MRLLAALVSVACLAASSDAQPDDLEGVQVAETATRTEPFSFDVAGRTLVGVLDTPVGREPLSTIIIVHGYGETDVVEGDWYADLRSLFASVGIRTLVWDKPGCGQSEGEFDVDQPVQSSADEVVAAVQALRERGAAGTETIGLWGISRAGWIAPLAMRDEPSLAFWISVSGTDDKENARYLLRQNFRIEGRSAQQVDVLIGEWQARFNTAWQGGTYEQYLDAGPTLDADPFMAFMGWSSPVTERDFYSYQDGFQTGELVVDEDDELMVYVPDLADVLASIDKPVLALFGDRDSNVDWQRTARLYRNTIGRGSRASLTVRVFPDTNHNMKRCQTCGVREMAEQPWHAPFAEGYHEAMTDWLVDNSFGTH